MRISDWSSDVCSSDLAAERSFLRPDAARGSRELAPLQQLLLQLPARRRPSAGAIALGAQGERPDRQHDHHVHERPWRTRRGPRDRSEEHTSELQSLMRISYAVFCLKQKNKQK